MASNILIIGLGYCGKEIEKQALEKNYKVFSTNTSIYQAGKPENIISLINEIKPKHIIITAPPITEFGNDCQILEDIKNDINQAHIHYISSTSVYGDHNNKWVNEESELKSKDAKGLQRIAAENAYTKEAQKQNFKLSIYRASGIYGEGRNVIERLRNGKAKRIFVEGHLFSRIHIEDIAAAIIKNFNHQQEQIEIYNLADNLPEANEKTISYAAELMNIKAPELVSIKDANLSPAQARYYNNFRKVSNEKLKTKLRLRLKYPTYKEGLKSLLTNN